MRTLTTSRGMLLGTRLFLAQDERPNAVAGLSAKPQEHHWQADARGLAAHAVYGLALETGLRLMDRPRRR